MTSPTTTSSAWVVVPDVMLYVEPVFPSSVTAWSTAAAVATLSNSNTVTIAAFVPAPPVRVTWTAVSPPTQSSSTQPNAAARSTVVVSAADCVKLSATPPIVTADTDGLPDDPKGLIRTTRQFPAPVSLFRVIGAGGAGERALLHLDEGRGAAAPAMRRWLRRRPCGGSAPCCVSVATAPVELSVVAFVPAVARTPVPARSNVVSTSLPPAPHDPSRCCPRPAGRCRTRRTRRRTRRRPARPRSGRRPSRQAPTASPCRPSPRPGWSDVVKSPAVLNVSRGDARRRGAGTGPPAAPSPRPGCRTASPATRECYAGVDAERRGDGEAVQVHAGLHDPAAPKNHPDPRPARHLVGGDRAPVERGARRAAGR